MGIRKVENNSTLDVRRTNKELEIMTENIIIVAIKVNRYIKKKLK
jgi:hypothetical protein